MTIPVDRCNHAAKVRLLGAEPRLWQCTGNISLSPNDEGCATLFVEGRPRLGEPAWIPAPVASHSDFACSWCLDGLCTSLDAAACPHCGTTSQRSQVAAR